MLAIISLTNSCNYSCEYCIATNPCSKFKTNKAKVCSKSGITEIRGCILDMDFLLRYLNEFIPESSTIVLTGGEPMSSPYFTTLICILTQRYKVIIETNGSQLFKMPNDIAQIARYGIELHIAWHPKMILFDKFVANVKSFKNRCQGVIAKLINIVSINDEINCLREEFEVIENNGSKPELGVKFWQDMIFIRPNGKVMECPGACANQIGDVYQGTLNIMELKNYYLKCSLQGHVFCNTILHVAGIAPTLRIKIKKE